MRQRHALTFIVLTMLIDATGFGIILPVLPTLLVEITGGTLAAASRWSGALMLVFALVSFVSAPVLGNLSDRLGRRPVLLVSLAAFAVNFLIMGFAETLLLLFIGRVLTGAAAATHGTASAYIADISAADQRAQNFGLMGMAFGFGFILGPVLGGIVGDQFGTRAPFFLAAMLAFANTIYGFLVLPETLAPDQRRKFELRRANPLGALALLRTDPVLLSVASGLLLMHTAHHVYPSIWGFYGIAKFDWSPTDIGLSLGAVGVGAALVSGLLIRWAIPRFGPARCAIIGLSCAVTAYLGFAVAPNTAVAYAFIVFSTLAGLTMPALTSVLSNRLPANQQGELQGAMASIGSIAAILGPPAMTLTFSGFTAPNADWYFPGAPFVLSAVLTVGTLLIVISTLLRSPRTAPEL